jgi:sn-1 stearoyl-lipid 9-desaturase
MSDLGPLPTVVREPVSSGAAAGGPHGPTRLPRPATVRQDSVVWHYVTTIAVIHLAALSACIPWLFSWTGVALAVLGVPFYGLGITLGYHRLLAHKSLAVPKWLEHGLALFAQCSLQDTPAKWVTVHRMHHVFSDEQPDPHSPLVNFVWSHFSWLFYQNTATRTIGSMQKYAHDILQDPFYMRLEKTYLGPAVYLAHLLMYPIVGAVVGWMTTKSGMGALQFSLSLFVWGGLVRTVLGWHATWSVNSLTHLIGYRNYETNEGSRNNWFVALVAVGEGWHNNHHSDPAAASVWHRWWEFDPTYCVIFLLESLGLATKVIEPKAVRRARRRRKARGAEQPISIDQASEVVIFDSPSAAEPHRAIRRTSQDDSGPSE